MGSKNMLEPQTYYLQERGDTTIPGFELLIIVGTWTSVNDTGHLKKKKKQSFVFWLFTVALHYELKLHNSALRYYLILSSKCLMSNFIASIRI